MLVLMSLSEKEVQLQFALGKAFFWAARALPSPVSRPVSARLRCLPEEVQSTGKAPAPAPAGGAERDTGDEREEAPGGFRKTTSHPER